MGADQHAADDDPRAFMRAAGAIEARIAGGTYEPGSRLHIGLIAEELGMGRDSVSRAMEVLKDRGLVRYWQGLGWFVTGSNR